jgi:uncharacterized protein YkwD
VTVTEVVDVYHYVWDDGTPVETPVETEAPKVEGTKPDYGRPNNGNWGAPAVEAPVVAEPAPVPAPSTGGSYSGAGQATPGNYADAVVAHHNAHRANHSAPALSWDSSLADTAYKIASSCVYAHDT